MKTEKEARKCWCPFARDTISGSLIEPGPGGSYNRMSGQDTLLPDSCYCIASECMAWRWEEPYFQDPATGINYNSPEPLNVADGTEMKKIQTGYCGLAGKP